MSVNRKSAAQLVTEAADMRKLIIEKMSVDGGHVGSPLAVIELIQALVEVFDFPKDKIVFDGAHQMHAYKLLTDRAEAFATMDHRGGIGEYADIHESPYDFYIGGRIGISISAALGYAVNHPEYKSIALLGDGSMTAGQPYEALNHAGALASNLLVIYNDNDFAVTETVGYLHTHNTVREFSESLGFDYVGAVDGHDTQQLIELLDDIKQRKHPVFLHVKTVKGKGYEPALRDPVTFHWLDPFDLETGALKKKPVNKFRDLILKKAPELAEKHGEVYWVSPAAARSTGLKELKKIYPDHVFDTGINEQHCVTFSAGLALNGNKVICFVPATFFPRALDQITDACMLRVPMVFVLPGSGISAQGQTLQGIYTLPILNAIPHATLYHPSSLADFDRLLDRALEHEHNGPVFLHKPGEDIEAGVTESGVVEVRDGGKLSVISIGNTLGKAVRLADALGDVQVLHIQKVAPVDLDALQRAMGDSSRMLILEDGFVRSGIGQHIVASLLHKPMRYEILGVRDRFPGIGTLDEVFEDIGFDDAAVLAAAQQLMNA
ncbi:1-deoxy-D-xylulose-5-phosphate synthase N-terminal domain-containing protein [Kitasatospora sp. NBC_01302]|uniref:1-deoxy-D-xylulose-5-phosphate synthase N-terminal domain-containing protein n=1 Tax=Kitasatospora sp. NBC_01302 TaxID=2903575 RepID=UPI002E0D7B4C|nr:thiamine pyrophosphate-dependent enzyme [Kitasatospora sp. NBC_01302]